MSLTNKQSDTDLLMAKAWSSEELKKQQAEISRMLTSIKKQRRALIDYIDVEENAALEQAVSTFEKLKRKVEHAKEKKKRLEKDERARIKLATGQAAKMLEDYLATLTFRQLITLAVCSDEWHFGSWPDVETHLNRFGVMRLECAIKNSVKAWVGTTSAYLGQSTEHQFDIFRVVLDQDVIRREVDKHLSSQHDPHLDRLMEKIDIDRAVECSENVERLQFGKENKRLHKNN